MKRIPELDGVRGVAILAVFFSHTKSLAGGYLGVDLFFVLSGYLITSILLNEFEKTGDISLRLFYYRRALRLLPALLVFASACALWTGWRATIPTLFYFANWRSFESLGPLAHTWSLSIEEQFYIIWPLLLLLPLRLRVAKTKIALALTILAALQFFWRLYLLKSGLHADRLYARTDTHSDGLLLGCIVALVPDLLRPIASKLAPAASWLLLFLFLSASWAAAVPSCAALTAAALCGGIVILAAQGRSSILQSRGFVYLGQRSYSLYLWHYPVTRYLMIRIPGSSTVKIAAAFALSLTLAELSYRLIELPFLKLKDRRVASRSLPTHSPHLQKS